MLFANECFVILLLPVWMATALLGLGLEPGSWRLGQARLADLPSPDQLNSTDEKACQLGQITALMHARLSM